MGSKAMILAAGLGSRLKSLTSDKPKALVEVDGKPMLERVIESLTEKGITHFMINIHHHGDKILKFLEDNNNFGVSIEISNEQDELLDTGGAIKKAATFFEGNSPVLVQNVDVITEVDLNHLSTYHHEKKALCSLCVRKRKSGRGLLFDENMELKGWVNHEKNLEKWVFQKEDGLSTYAFSGIYLVQPDFANLLPFGGKFSIIDAWLEMAKTNKIFGFVDDSESWFDIGTKEKLDKAEKYIKTH